MVNIRKTILDMMAFSTKQRELLRLQIESQSAGYGKSSRSATVDAYSQIINILGSLARVDDAQTKEAQGADDGFTE
ncbi:MAG: hypothetical protein ACPGWR_09085 [Ardenticatenaceae bacterium]